MPFPITSGYIQAALSPVGISGGINSMPTLSGGDGGLPAQRAEYARRGSGTGGRATGRVHLRQVACRGTAGRRAKSEWRRSATIPLRRHDAWTPHRGRLRPALAIHCGIARHPTASSKPQHHWPRSEEASRPIPPRPTWASRRWPQRVNEQTAGHEAIELGEHQSGHAGVAFRGPKISTILSTRLLCSGSIARS